MNFPAVLMTLFADGKITTEVVDTPDQLQLSMANAQTLTGATRITVFEHHETLSKQTVWASPPTTH